MAIQTEAKTIEMKEVVVQTEEEEEMDQILDFETQDTTTYVVAEIQET